MQSGKLFIAGMLLLSASCQQIELAEPVRVDERHELNIQGVINQEYVTRADDNGFATGDKMGVYIIDYEGENPGSLTESQHRASNMIYTYNADDNSWNNSTTLYWKDSVTPVDIYGYYPGVDHIDNPAEYSFEVASRQDIIPSDGSMSAYEASDFMWAKVANVAPTSDVIILNYNHRMAGVNVKLVKGSGIQEADWSSFSKTVQVDNVIRYATIDIADGIPAPIGAVDKSILMLPQSGDSFRAVVVPQTVDAGKTLLSITIDGRTYTHSLATDMVYKMGKLHNFTITVNKSENSGDYQCSLSYDGIVEWTNDETSHNFESNSYITINVPEAGTLESVLSDKKINPADIENLKLTGCLNETDFNYIRSRMSRNLRRINLKEVRFVHVLARSYWSNEQQCQIDEYFDDYLPNNAFENMTYLRHIILPVDLKHIGRYAFNGVELTSSLLLPEGLTHVYDHAFCGVFSIEMPSSLEYIGEWVFRSGITGELRLTDNLKHIGRGAFLDAQLTGTFYLPSKLEYLGEEAFGSFGKNLSGDIVIPSTITEVPSSAFRNMGFANGTNLILHDGIKRISERAFQGTKIKNSLSWPVALEIIQYNAFAGCGINMYDFDFPDNIKSIGAGAFNGNHIQGILEVPESLTLLESGTSDLYIGAADVEGVFSNNDIESVVISDNLLHIGKMSFRNCARLSKIHIGKNVEYIGRWALGGCASLNTLVCMAQEPPIVHKEAFDAPEDWTADIDFEKCVLQVPEMSVEKYRNTEVWNQFKNITAYKELAFNIPEIVTLDKETVRSGIIRAEGPWEVTECPSWVTVSPSSGQGKAEVTVTVEAHAAGVATREGKIVFSLKDKDYTTYTDVRQVGAEVGEDQTIILQEASAGASKAIPLFIIGDGYNADDIASGKYLADMTEQMEHFFSIEPLRSYREYFTVSTAYAVSPESGVNGLTRFNSEYYIDLHGDNDMVRDYAGTYGVGINGNESAATILVLMNTDATVNTTSLYDDGLAISWMGKSGDVYPYDQRGCVLHEFAGKAFGKLGPEKITHMTFLDACKCPGCNVSVEYERAQRNGWWKNVSKTNKLKSLPWYHLMFHEKYSSIVDVYEGACNHSRGAYRSENQSVMGNAYVHYFNTISRELLVKRIMECAGEEFVFDDFVSKDVIELPE